MNSNLTIINAKVVAGALLVFLLVCSGVVHGQDKSSTPRKFDEFEDMRTSDIKARLDLFAQQLVQDQSLRGLIVGYRQQNWQPGSHLRYVYGFHDYLVNKRGVDPTRLKVEGRTRENTLTELWLLPSGASFPPASADTASLLDTVMRFDQLTFGPDCESEYSLVLERPEDAVKFFADGLRRHPTTKGFVLVHPSKREPRGKAAKLAAGTRESLTQEYGIAAGRISASLESRRHCSEIDLWFVPASLVVPRGVSPHLFFQSQLMAEAEQNEYAVRRVELIGNARTRDNVIRRRLLQNEGDIFQRKLLEQSLSNVSKLRNFDRVSIQDVDVQLNREDKTVDFLIHLTERTSSRKRRTQ